MPVDYAAAASAAARRYCGWVVTPPETVTITVDGPGGQVLSVPSLRLTTVSAVVEDGVALDVSDLAWSVATGTIWKKSRSCWTHKRGSIVVTMTHGFIDAPDFDVAVAMAATALAANVRTDMALKRLKVDDVETEWWQMGSSFLNESLLAPYRILLSP